MMDPAFFVGRKAILDWLNETFHYNLNKVEETASGADTRTFSSTRRAYPAARRGNSFCGRGCTCLQAPWRARSWTWSSRARSP